MFALESNSIFDVRSLCNGIRVRVIIAIHGVGTISFHFDSFYNTIQVHLMCFQWLQKFPLFLHAKISVHRRFT